MAINPRFPDEASVPEWAKDSVTKDEASGEFGLQVQGYVDGSRLNEFRNSNRDLNSTVAKLKDEIDSKREIDPDQYRQMQEQIQQQDDGGSKELEAQVQQLRSQFDTYREQAGAREKEVEAERTDLAQQRVKASVAAAGTEPGVSDSGVTDVQLRAERELKFVDGATVAVDDQGNPRYSEREPTKLMTPQIWIQEQLLPQAPHLFKRSKGANAANEGIQSQKIDANDPLTFGRNLEAIAKGQVTVS